MYVDSLKNSEKLGKWENGLIVANKVVICCAKIWSPFSTIQV